MLSIVYRQQNLKYYRNYYTDKLDGVEGTNTKNAYRNFQAFHGLKVDGVYGLQTEGKLLEIVKQIQNKLNEYGYGLVVDGVIGNITVGAIKDYQKKNGLAVDGIVGPVTWNSLFSEVKPSVDTVDTADMSKEDYKNIKYFVESEFVCECGCGEKRIKRVLVKNLDKVREQFGRTTVTSGVRCVKQNKKDGGVTNSPHLPSARAADIYIKNVTDTLAGRKEVIEWFLNNCEHAYYGYCNGYSQYKGENSTYRNAPNMGNAVHLEIRL